MIDSSSLAGTILLLMCTEPEPSYSKHDTLEANLLVGFSFQRDETQSTFDEMFRIQLRKHN
eukprot:m.366470 g.366470  ORF g.366470 m.366470 type:complete len:61 (+) comp36185_c0_seq1:55-237(+)